jgi:hypothetical protein
VLVAPGCDHANYDLNPIILAGDDRPSRPARRRSAPAQT